MGRYACLTDVYRSYETRLAIGIQLPAPQYLRIYSIENIDFKAEYKAEYFKTFIINLFFTLPIKLSEI